MGLSGRDGVRLHYSAAGGVDRTLCARALDPAAVVHPDLPRRMFSLCIGCRDAGADYPLVPVERSAPAQRVPGRPEPAFRREARPARRRPESAAVAQVSPRIRQRLIMLPVVVGEPTGEAGTWKLPRGWAQLPGSPVWHRLHPYRWDWVTCELGLPAGAARHRWRTTSDDVCADCEAVRTRALRELRGRDQTEGRPATPPRRAAAATPPRAQIVRGGLPGLGRSH